VTHQNVIKKPMKLLFYQLQTQNVIKNMQIKNQPYLPENSQHCIISCVII